MQTNKTALKQLEKTKFLVASAKAQKPMVNDRLTHIGPEIFGDDSGEVPSVPDWNQLQEWGIAALESSAQTVRQTEKKHRQSRVRLSKTRRDRNRQLAKVSASHRALRQSMAGTYGPESLPLLGLDAVPAKALMAVQEQMRGVVGLMRDPQSVADLPEPLAGQKPIDFDSVADARDAEIGDLESKMEEIDALRKQVDEDLVVRDEALAQNRRVYSNVGRLLEGVYRLAGLDELADRIRATQRAARKKSEGEPDQESTDPDAEPTDQASDAESSDTAQEGGDVA